MEILTALLSTEGLTPEALVRRGAPTRYVSAVCQKMSDAVKKRKELWLTTREVDRGESEVPEDARLSTSTQRRRSYTPEVEVSVQMGRTESISSESSAEMKLIDRLSPASPPRARLLPTSSWTPERVAVVDTRKNAAPPSHAIRIESYKPTPDRQGQRLGTANSNDTTNSTLRAASLLLDPVSIPRSLASRISSSLSTSSYALEENVELPQASVKASQPHTSPPKPIVTIAPLPGPISFGGREQTPSSSQHNIFNPPSSLGHAQPIFPATAPPNLPVQLITKPSISAPAHQAIQSQVDSDIAAKSAILDIRRKALESMRSRRARAEVKLAVLKGPDDMDIDAVTPTAFVSLAPSTAEVRAEKTIEQEVADLEQEVLTLQAATSPTTMEMDEPEEGEIASTPSPPIVHLPIASASLPDFRVNRNLKRPNAEDLESRPTTAAVRILPPSKRRVFGGVAQRPNRLVISLDESDSESDPESPKAAAETQRLLAEKEEGIRRLKEQIAERMRVRQLQKLQLPRSGRASAEGSPTPIESVITEEVLAAVEATPSSAMSIGRWPVATLHELHA